MRVGLLALVWSALSCADGPPTTVAAGCEPPPPTIILIGERELDQYERGRRAELVRLRAAGPRLTGADSAGARAAGLGVAQYDAMTRLVERYLRQRAGAGSGRLARLDSLRVEHLVLLLQR